MTVPVVGIGGIGIPNIDDVKSTGIDGISLISAILGQDDNEEAARNLINLCRIISIHYAKVIISYVFCHTHYYGR